MDLINNSYLCNLQGLLDITSFLAEVRLYHMQREVSVNLQNQHWTWWLLIRMRTKGMKLCSGEKQGILASGNNQDDVSSVRYYMSDVRVDRREQMYTMQGPVITPEWCEMKQWFLFRGSLKMPALNSNTSAHFKGIIFRNHML